MRLGLAVVGLLCASAVFGAAPDGATVYKQHCALCHDQAAKTRSPGRDSLAKLTTVAINAALTAGSMAVQGAPLSDAEKHAVAEFLTGKPYGSDKPAETAAQGVCPAGGAALKDPFKSPHWNGWGVTAANTRFQPADQARLSAADVPKLKLKWAFAFPGVAQVGGQPTVVGGRVFVGSMTTKVYSLDAATGCTYWTFDAGAPLRGAITIGAHPGSSKLAAYFGDLKSTAYAIDASTGELIWKTKVEDHPVSRITGSPSLHEGRLYVPVSSVEEVAAANAKYECCKFRGSVVALDAGTGKQLWKTFTIEEVPSPTKKNKVGTQLWGPAGAAVWSSPTIDAKRKAIYIGTGNAYIEPDPGTDDSIMALDMESGKILWSVQMSRKDWFSLACPNKENCPEEPGPDFDFGSSPILRRLPNGKDIIAVGQKSGMVFGLDPDNKGEMVWQARVGRGSALGGVEWGPAADEKTMYVAVSDVANPGPDGAGGLSALELATGKQIWRTPAPKPCTAAETPAKPVESLASFGKKGCSGAQSAAISVIPGVVFSGSIDGHFRAFSASDGKIIWDVDTAKEYSTVNGVKGKGGSLDSAGPTIVNGMVYVNSGYGLFQGMPGNVLLAFSVDGK